MASFLSDHPKTHNCGALRKSDEGATVSLTGWVTIAATTVAAYLSIFAIVTDSHKSSSIPP